MPRCLGEWGASRPTPQESVENGVAERRSTAPQVDRAKAACAAATARGVWAPADRDGLAPLALVADTCADELVACGAARVLSDVVGRADAYLEKKLAPSEARRALDALGDAAAALEQLGLYVAERQLRLDADEDDALLGEMLAEVPEAQAALEADRAARQQSANRRSEALRDCPAAHARRAVERLVSRGPGPAPAAWVRAVDSLAACVIARAAPVDDPAELLEDRANVAFLDVLLRAERLAAPLRPCADERYYFGPAGTGTGGRAEIALFAVSFRRSLFFALPAPSGGRGQQSTAAVIPKRTAVVSPSSACAGTGMGASVLWVLAAIARSRRGRDEIVALGGHDLLPAIDAANEAAAAEEAADDAPSSDDDDVDHPFFGDFGGDDDSDGSGASDDGSDDGSSSSESDVYVVMETDDSEVSSSEDED